jgi:pectate lyase
MHSRRAFLTRAAAIPMVTALPLQSLRAGPAVASGTGVRAFPSAEGFGSASVGGRGGRVVEVVNLNDSGPGSLRSAVEASGPRTIVFRTGGTILLRKPLILSNPYVTIAGQTAPGGGICLRSDRSNYKPCLFIRTHDVVVRFLRVRPGPCSGSSQTLDGVRINGRESSSMAYNVILDHCSVSWAVDECLEIGVNSRDITTQWCIISEGLNDSVHPEGPHSRGMLIREQNSYNLSVHHNLFAHNEYRNPQVSNEGRVDVRNNVVYGWTRKAMSSSDVVGVPVKLNAVANYFKAGPDSSTSLGEIDLHPIPPNPGWQAYVRDNIGPHRLSVGLPDSLSVSKLDTRWLVSTPAFQAPSVATTTASQAYVDVLSAAGASRPGRDTVDARVIDNVRDGTGRLVDHPDQVGGWPFLAPGNAPVDSDHDGIPDAWEIANGLDPYDARDAARHSSNGYTNLENYLNQLAGDSVPA